MGETTEFSKIPPKLLPVPQKTQSGYFLSFSITSALETSSFSDLYQVRTNRGSQFLPQFLPRTLKICVFKDRTQWYKALRFEPWII